MQSVVEEPYDYSHSTEDNYTAAPEDAHLFSGEFAESRRTLDYDYHHHYTAARQAVQDDIVRGFLCTVVRDCNTSMYCSRPTEPWVVFTAGAMGAGKSRAMRWMSQEGYFPLESFIQVDPDVIRCLLPETPAYIAKDPETAGEMTQKEAGYIQEILVHEGLSRGLNILVDGSLRNAEWHKTIFAGIRAEYPGTRLAIFHVVAEPAEVIRRANRRGARTGRVVPAKLILQALEEVPRSVAELSPLVEYSVRISTDGPHPELETAGETWATFSEHWRLQCPENEGIPHPGHSCSQSGPDIQCKEVQQTSSANPSLSMSGPTFGGQVYDERSARSDKGLPGAVGRHSSAVAGALGTAALCAGATSHGLRRRGRRSPIRASRLCRPILRRCSWRSGATTASVLRTVMALLVPHMWTTAWHPAVASQRWQGQGRLLNCVRNRDASSLRLAMLRPLRRQAQRLQAPPGEPTQTSHSRSAIICAAS